MSFAESPVIGGCEPEVSTCTVTFCNLPPSRLSEAKPKLPETNDLPRKTMGRRRACNGRAFPGIARERLGDGLTGVETDSTSSGHTD